MPNPWVEHVKAWAKEHNEPYGCSLSDPACKIEYMTKGTKQRGGERKIFKTVSYKENDVSHDVYTKTGKLSKSQSYTSPGKSYNYDDLKNLAQKTKKIKKSK
jgi:hypothetical protein